MVVVPQLCGDKQILTIDRPVSQQLFECCADLYLATVPLCTVEVSESHFDGVNGGIARLTAIGNQRAKPERRDVTVAVVQDKSVLPVAFNRYHVVRTPC